MIWNQEYVIFKAQYSKQWQRCCGSLEGDGKTEQQPTSSIGRWGKAQQRKTAGDLKHLEFLSEYVPIL